MSIMNINGNAVGLNRDIHVPLSHLSIVHRVNGATVKPISDLQCKDKKFGYLYIYLITFFYLSHRETLFFKRLLTNVFMSAARGRTFLL